MSRRAEPAIASVDLRDKLIAAGLEPHLADVLDGMPAKFVTVEPRKPFREEGAGRDEVMFVRSGLLCKYKSDSNGMRQIVALRFPGEGILPRHGNADYGIQAVSRSVVKIGRASDLEPIVEANPELQRFFWRLVQRNEAIGYEWLVNCGRRDSTARVAHLLCETQTRMMSPPEQLSNPFTQQQIAEITGQTSVNVNRVFADFERQGLIKRRGREIHINDPIEFRRLASFQPDYLR
ncbi:MAG: Crp/Fnr family transcriptional regulator [Sphingomicrobium sp.]